MKKISLSAFGSVITAIVASLCCIGPLLVALLGVGSIGAFTFFENYRPYFIGITVVLLGVAFYIVYRKREVPCEDGTCKIEDAGKWNKLGVWSATFLAVIAIAFPYWGVALPNSPKVTAQSKAVVSLNIEGMDCKACAVGMEGSLNNIHGVHKARINFEKGLGIVEYDSTVVKPDVLVGRVKENGFDATIIEHKKGN
ncbi:MAG: cation transporter [Ignavibacteriales bacterium]|nr:cation transporter [Ignavibacteriales bacterium]